MLKVFLEVGEAIEGVSRRSPVVLLPKVEGKDAVLRESLGLRLGGAGRETGACEGRIASDIVSGGMKASITRVSTII